MNGQGQKHRGRRRAFFIAGSAWLIVACSSPNRDFGTASEQAGAGGLADGGAAGRAGAGAAGRVDSGQAGSNAPSSEDAGVDARAGTGGDGGAETGGEPGGDAGAGVGGGQTVECAAGLQRSCADDGVRGSCALGTELCASDGKWGACSITKKTDSCVQGNDDSCNGVANEGCGCVDGKESACDGAKGNCAGGTQKCSAGVLAACTISPQAQDTCAPGDDANCNGIPNEGCACKNGDTQSCGPTKAVGKCKLGSSTCSNGAYGTCVGAVNKANRDCRSPDDNDCDGLPDNTVDTVCGCSPGTTKSCNAHAGFDGKGVCKAGTAACVASSDNSSSYWGACTGDVAPGKRNCASSLDNDCNSTPDNKESACACTPGAKQACMTHPQDGKGICKAGTQTCNLASDGMSSAWTTCSGDVAPKARDCTSHLDNDCDGVLDDAISGACQCTATSCAASTSCKLSPSASQCVACVSNSDCSNGGTCAANVCQCTSSFNGNRCQYQTFRGLGVPLGDAVSSVINISPDGSTVVGDSQPTGQTTQRAWRFANGALNVIPRPSGQTFCSGRAVDTSGAIYGACEDSSFQYVNGATTVISFSTYTAYAADVSRDGKVIVGTAEFDGQQAVRRSGTTTTLIPKLGSDFSAAYATNSDGSVVVGDEYVFGHIGWFWTQKTGNTVQLPALADFGNYDPSDVSADGTVVVGYEAAGTATPRAVKWFGTNFSSIETKPGHYNSTSSDGKVIVGYTGDSPTVATVWDANGAHVITSFVDAASLSGWSLTEATAVSDDGKWVTGNGTHNSVYEPWLVHLP